MADPPPFKKHRDPDCALPRQDIPPSRKESDAPKPSKPEPTQESESTEDALIKRFREIPGLTDGRGVASEVFKHATEEAIRLAGLKAARESEMLRKREELLRREENLQSRRDLENRKRELDSVLNPPEIPPRDRGLLDKVTPVELGPASEEIQDTGYSNAEVKDSIERRNLPHHNQRVRSPYGSANGGEGAGQPAFAPKKRRSPKVHQKKTWSISKDPKQEPKDKNQLGWLAFALALVERGLDVIGFQNLLVGALLFLGAFAAFVVWFFGWEKARQWRLSRRALIVCVAALVYFPLVGYQLYAQYKGNTIAVVRSPSPVTDVTAPPVYPLFQSAHDDHSKELGSAKKEAEPLQNPAYYAEHEHAKAIWIRNSNKFYLLSNDFKWREQAPAQGELWSEWIDDEHNLKMLRPKFGLPPKGKYPPYGGMALGWDNDASNWAWVGWRLWHCSYSPGTPDETLHIQTFERGVIIGGYALNPSGDNGQVIFVLMNTDQKWSTKTILSRGPRCGPPGQKPN